MRIYSMTATFGKLEHETLTLQPGLNIIEAPNEWGKSTWCAFLINMLYGIETRARSTKDAIAEKERYAPWSGAPMSGRIDLNWNGRNITIQRATKGRLIFGDFRAYETDTGVDVPELTASNCGQKLLGVERSVFTRAGFLKLTDLPVTQDDSLRRRLNDLVTTGDESGDGDNLAQALKDLKNRCRYNRSGLLPQAESERDLLRNQLEDLHDLQNQAQELQAQQIRLDWELRALENHRDALDYAASLENSQRVADGEAAELQAQQKLTESETACASLPSAQLLKERLQKADTLQRQLLELRAQPLPQAPAQPEVPDRYRDMTPEGAISQAILDAAREQELKASIRKPSPVLFVIGGLLTAAGIGLLFYDLLIGCAAAAVGVALLAAAAILHSKALRHNSQTQAQLEALRSRYGDAPAAQWKADAEEFAKSQREYAGALALYKGDQARRDHALRTLEENIASLAGQEPLEDCRTRWSGQLTAWDTLEAAQREFAQAQRHAQALRAMVKPVEPAKEPDELTWSAPETDRLLAECRLAHQRNQLALGQCQGKMENIGQEAQLRVRLDALNRRIARLEDTYYALEMAQDALHNATTELQRRFAPRISKRAQTLFSKLTGGRYQKITLGSDLSLSAAAENEDTLHSAQWRSDGTVDQLYLALRLAVAEELTPEAPLVLDDALVRFDDTRLRAALELLREAAETKQVILFTCQGREKRMLPS